MHGGLEGMVNVKGVVWGFGRTGLLVWMWHKDVSQGMIGDPKRRYAVAKMGWGARSWRVGYIGG